MEQFHDATWVGVNSDWMSQLLYEWQKFMNNIYPFLFSDPWRSYTFQQSWKVSNNIAIVNVYTTPPWMCIYHCPIHIRDHCEWSQDIPSHIIQTPFLNQWHSSIFTSYISSYNKYIVFSRWSWFWEIGWYIEKKWKFIKPRISTRLYPHRIIWGRLRSLSHPWPEHTVALI